MSNDFLFASGLVSRNARTKGSRLIVIASRPRGSIGMRRIPASMRLLLSVWMRDVLGSCDHPEGVGQDGRVVGRLVAWVDELGRSRKAFVDDHLRGSALQDPLASSSVGLVEAPQQG